MQTMKQILTQEVEFFTDEVQPSDVYVEYPAINGSRIFASVDSTHFASFLSHRYYFLNPDEDELPDYRFFLERQKNSVIYSGDRKVQIHHRIAGNMADKIYYTLSNNRSQAVRITSEGWKICSPRNVKFLARTTDKEQVAPIGGSNYLDLILPRLNMDHDTALLYAVFLAQAFSRSSSHYCAVISSDKGTGKSTLTKLTTDLIEPVTNSCSITPTTIDHMITTLANGYIASFDNTSRLSGNFSDLLCAAITGTKATKRKLYTNATPLVLSLHNLVIMNGVDIVPYRSDLAERSLFFNLQTISESKRRTDADFWGSFNEDKPKILGAIFDTLSKAMAILPTLQMDKLFRMSDAHREMTAIAVALGIDQQNFQDIMRNNRKNLQEAYANTDGFVDFVLSYVARNPCRNVPAQKLFLQMMEKIVGSHDFFPKSPSALSRRLKNDRETFESLGYSLDFNKTPTSNTISIQPIASSKRTKAQAEAIARRNELLKEDHDE